MNSDFRDLLQALNDAKADYLVIGGYAVMRYTEPRYTKDLDILIGTSRDNATRVYNALQQFGAPTQSLRIDDLCTPGVFFQIGVAPNRVDIITSVPGVNFDTAYARRSPVTIDGLVIPFIALEDLINAKLSAGRPQDLVDAGALAKARKQK